MDFLRCWLTAIDLSRFARRRTPTAELRPRDARHGNAGPGDLQPGELRRQVHERRRAGDAAHGTLKRGQSKFFVTLGQQDNCTVKFETPLTARAAVRALAASKIRELYNEGIGRKDVLAFWVGEPDEPTPQFIREAATESIAGGEVFYTHNLGIPELREALARYISQLHTGIDPDEVAITSAGVNALMIASQLLVDPGDRVVEVVPLWPNLQEIPKILGAQVATVALEFKPSGWELDVEKLLGELQPGTKALYLNSPNNPTGWTVSAEQQRAILEHCRKHGIWIFADDAYERLYFEEGGVAPSFLDIAEEGDRVISANTFSKSWLMTGWRLGWLVVPRGLVADLGKLIEYNTSC